MNYIKKINLYKITLDYIIIFLKVIRRTQTSKINQNFSCNHKINESNRKVSTYFELSACILNMFVFVFLCPINFLISLEKCST